MVFIGEKDRRGEEEEKEEQEILTATFGFFFLQRQMHICTFEGGRCGVLTPGCEKKEARAGRATKGRKKTICSADNCGGGGDDGDGSCMTAKGRGKKEGEYDVIVVALK